MSNFSEYDKEHFGEILSGQGDWFGAHLARLIRKADPFNRERLRFAFPDEVGFYEEYAEEQTVITPTVNLGVMEGLITKGYCDRCGVYQTIFLQKSNEWLCEKCESKSVT